MEETAKKAENILLATSAYSEPNNLREADMFVESFWYWNKFSSYCITVGILNAVLLVTTYLFQEDKQYAILLGFLSSFIEAMLGVPQFYLNFTRRNTFGLSITLILMWLFGDLFKLYYYGLNEGPVELVLCSVFQVCIDLSIIS